MTTANQTVTPRGDDFVHVTRRELALARWLIGGCVTACAVSAGAMAWVQSHSARLSVVERTQSGLVQTTTAQDRRLLILETDVSRRLASLEVSVAAVRSDVKEALSESKEHNDKRFEILINRINAVADAAVKREAGR